MDSFYAFYQTMCDYLFMVVIPFLAQPLGGEAIKEMSLSQLCSTSYNLTCMGKVVLAFVVVALASVIRPPFESHRRIYRPAILLVLCRVYYEAELGLLDHLVQPGHTVQT